MGPLTSLRMSKQPVYKNQANFHVILNKDEEK